MTLTNLIVRLVLCDHKLSQPKGLNFPCHIGNIFCIIVFVVGNIKRANHMPFGYDNWNHLLSKITLNHRTILYKRVTFEKHWFTCINLYFEEFIAWKFVNLWVDSETCKQSHLVTVCVLCKCVQAFDVWEALIYVH